MADTNTYVSKQKVEKWTTKEKFNAFDLSDIPVGTEYNLTGPIGANDLDVDLQTKINEVSNKLTKPTNPSAEAAVTMLADGTVGTKLLSEIGGGKLYKHYISISAEVNDGVRPTFDGMIYFEIYSSSQTAFTLNTIPEIGGYDYYAGRITNVGHGGQGLVAITFNGVKIVTYGASCIISGEVIPLYYEIPYENARMTDDYTEI